MWNNTNEAAAAMESFNRAVNEFGKTESEKECERIRRFEVFAGGYFPEKAKGYMVDGGFFRQTASTHYHSAHFGGLADHSHAVTEALLDYTRKMGLVWEKERSPYLVGYLHDICKMDEYILKEVDGVKSYEFNRDRLLIGHGEKSAILAAMLIPDLTDEEMFCIRYHHGAFENSKDAWNAYGHAIEKYPNVLYTHTADMAASRIKRV
ncbi:MAG: hypothetical protein NC345_13470 [Lachnospira sp.]|nr:hypothetical protein [Lachnospira sp.]